MKEAYIVLCLRAFVVGSKPAVLLFLAIADEKAANELARLLIWASFTTAAASLSYYKTYMAEAINGGLRSVLPQIATHTSYTACFFGLIVIAANLDLIIFVVLVLDFALHQLSRVLLYQKRMYWWFGVSVSVTPVLAAVIVLQHSLLSVIHGLSLAAMFIFAYNVAQSLRKIEFSAQRFEFSQSFLGLGRKLILSIDKLLASVLIDSASFWVLGILYQIGNAAQTAFDATKMMPIKREIALRKLNFGDIKVAAHNLWWSTISALVAGAFLFSQTSDLFMVFACFFVFLLRGGAANFFSFTMEVFFWQYRLGRITLLMLVCVACYGGVMYWVEPTTNQYYTAFLLTFFASLVALFAAISTRLRVFQT